MGFIRKFRLELILGAAFVIFYFFIRLYHILNLPIFTDEAIYLRWAQIAKQDAAFRFISLTDGKQPIFVWFAMVAMRFIHDPLLAGRLVSVGAGFTTMAGLFFLGRELFKNTWIGILCALLYLISPFALVYDRMALYDSLVGTFAVWGLYFEVLLVRKVRLDIALLASLIIGGGMLTKTNAFFNLYLLPFTLILFDFKGKQWSKKLLKLAGLFVLVVFLSNLYYSVLRLSPYFHIITEKNALFIFPLKEWLTQPFRFFWGNLLGEWDWLHTYLTVPVLVLAGISFIGKSFRREKWFLLLWFLIPFVATALFGKVLYPRFIFFMTLFLLPLAAYSIQRLYELFSNRTFFSLCFVLAISASLFSDYRIVTNFSIAPIPDSDLNQYSNDWPSGGGVKEAVAFFNEQAKNGKIYVATEGTFGLMPYSLELYLVGNPNIKIQGYWPIEKEVPKEVIEMSKKIPAYFVFYQPCVECAGIGIAPSSWQKNIKPIYIKYKFYDSRRLSIYQVLP